MASKEVQKASIFTGISYDSFFTGTLTSELAKAFFFFHPSVIKKYSTEIAMIPEFMSFYWVIKDNKLLPGLSWENARFTNQATDKPILTKKQKVLYFFCKFVIKYGWKKLTDFIDNKSRQNSTEWKRVKSIINFLQNVFNFQDLLNFVSFLYDGRFPELVFRIANIGFMKCEESKIRFYDFKYVNRTVSWNTLSNFILYILPIIKNFGAGFLGKAFKTVYESTTIVGTLTGGAVGEDEIIEQNCRFCKKEVPSMPRVLKPCKHVFCYYCLEQNESYINEQKCPFCLQNIDKITNKI